MANLHGVPDTLKEIQAISGDLLPACLLTSAGVTAPGSGLTIAAASCTAYARSGIDLVYIDQPAVSVTVPNVAGSHWLIAHRDTYSAVASWTRRAGSHFLTQQAATQPTIPDGAVLVAQLTVAGGNLTAVSTDPALSPPLSRQTADAVAITGGTAFLSTATIGGSPAGVFALNVFPWKAFASQLAVGDGASVALLGGYKLLTYGPALHQHNKGSAQHGLTMQAVGADAGAFTQLFLNVAGTPIGSISTTAAATAFNTSSDVRLKEGIAALTGALDVVRALRPVRFRWRADDRAGHGFLAHEVQPLVPEAVTGEPDAVDGDGQIVPQQMDASKLIPWLCGAVQELAAQVAALQTRLGV